jgi:hypothetical protein
VRDEDLETSLTALDAWRAHKGTQEATQSCLGPVMALSHVDSPTAWTCTSATQRMVDDFEQKGWKYGPEKRPGPAAEAVARPQTEQHGCCGLIPPIRAVLGTNHLHGAAFHV